MKILDYFRNMNTKARPVRNTGYRRGVSYNFFDSNKQNFAQLGYLSNVVAYQCVKLIATAAAGVEMELYQRDEGGERREIYSHDILDILAHPNPVMDGREFTETYISEYQIYGEAFAVRAPILGEGTGAPVELWTLNANDMSVVDGGMGFPESYAYRKQTSDEKIFPVDQANGRTDILYMKSYHPLRDINGLSAMQPAKFSIDIHNSAQKHNFNLLKNGATPSLGLQTLNEDGKPARLSEEEREQMYAWVDECLKGENNAGSVILLESLGIEKLSMNARDMDFINSVWMAARNIATAYGVPPQLINIPGESTYNNMQEAKLAFWQDTMLPLMDKYTARLTHWLVPMYGESKTNKLIIGYNKDKITALEPRRQQMFERAQNADFLTINEKREMVGKEAVDGGDGILVDATKVPLELAGFGLEDGNDETTEQ